MESKHDYEPNTHQLEELHIAGASRMTITFDPRTRTEDGCVASSRVLTPLALRAGDPSFSAARIAGVQLGYCACTLPGQYAICSASVDPTLNAIVRFYIDVPVGEHGSVMSARTPRAGFRDTSRALS